MRSLLLILCSVFITDVARGEPSAHFRPLFHGTHARVDESRFGVAGWVVAPSLGDDASTWFGVVGPRYDGDGWNVELMAGALISGADPKAKIDLRAELTPELLGLPLYTWLSAEWIEPSTGYFFLMFDYVLPGGIALVGVETEHTSGPDVDVNSVGPQLVFPLGRLAMILAYQFHLGDEPDQLWLRMIVHL